MEAVGGNTGRMFHSVKGGFSSGEYQGAITLTLLGKDIQERSRIERALLNHPNRVNGQHRTHERKDSSHRFYDILGYNMYLDMSKISKCIHENSFSLPQVHPGLHLQLFNEMGRGLEDVFISGISFGRETFYFWCGKYTFFLRTAPLPIHPDLITI